jgi:iron complex outermembrane receptor protein
MKTALFAGSALAFALCAQAAQAQDGGTDEQVESTAEAEESQGGINVITVTAQRREETLQDAAIAINAATGEDLIRSGVTDASGLNKIAPSLYVSTGGGANAGYFVRGVGNFTNNGYTAPAVAFNIDGVYMGRPSSTIASFLDVNRVEVLKGPQGTLYGRNATGGAINVIPNTPRLGLFEGEVSAQYGNYDAYELTGVINVPVAETIATRFAASYSDRDGYFSDGTGSAEDLALRGQIYAEISDAIDARLSVDYSTQQGTGPGLNVDGVFVFTPFNPAATIPNWTFVEAPASVSEPYTGLHAPQTLGFIAGTATAAPLFSPLTGYAYPFRDDEYFGVNAELNFDLGGVDLVVIPAYRRSELDNQFNGPPFKAAINQNVAKQYSLEARLSGDVGPLEWILGGYWFDEKVTGLDSYNQFSTTNFNDFVSTTESLAFFARGSFSVTDELRLVGGIRYTDESRSIDAHVDSVAGVCLIEPPAGPPQCPQVPTLPVALTLDDALQQLGPALFPGRSPFVPPVIGAYPYGPFGPMGPGALFVVTPTDIVRDSGDEEFTFRAAIEYDVTPDNLLYASYESGFRAGGFNISFGNEEYEPEFIDAYTIGSKNSFFDNRLQVNLEAFYWDYRGQQLAALGVDGRGNNSFYTRNVGESSVKGVEIDFQVLATETTLFRGGVQYLDATYDSFQYNQVDLSDPTDPPNFLTPITGCPYTQVLAPVRSFNIDCSGMPALYAPDWSFNLGVDQTIATGFGEFTAIIDTRYRADRVIGFNYLPTEDGGDDFTIDASLSFEPDSVPLTVTAFVRNLTNEAIPSVYQVGAGNVASAAYEPPRTYGLRLGYEF